MLQLLHRTHTKDRDGDEPQPQAIEQLGAADGIALRAEHLSVKIGHGRTILHDVSLNAEPGELTAIVGGSGTGKSTLLRALSGAHPATSGSVLLNGLPLYDHFSSLRTQIGFVPQDDIIHRRLGVYRALRYAADLRMPADTGRKARAQRTDEVIDELGLQEQRKTRIADLSGGQRKRVNIAVELLTRPPLLFLDEPGAGLDPATEARLMQRVRELADAGHTVVLVTHAVQNLELANKVLFLTAGGRTAFFGSPQEALAYFGVADLTDVYTLLDDERSPAEWEETFQHSSLYRSDTAPAEPHAPAAGTPAETSADVARVGRPRKEPGQVRQFGILTRRYATIILNDPKYLLVLLLQAPIIALLLWALFPTSVFTRPHNLLVLARQGSTLQIVQQDPQTGRLLNPPPGAELVAFSGEGCASAIETAITTQALPTDCHVAAGNGNNAALKAAQLAFFLAAVAVWLGTLNAIREISKEHAIYRRERMVNLRIVPYVASKFVVLTTLVIVQCALLLGVAAAHIRMPGTVQHWTLHLPHQLGDRVVSLPYPTGPVDGILLSLVLAGAASIALALAVSAAVSNPDRAIVAAPLIMVPQIMFAGGLTPVQDLGPAKWLSVAVATRWGYEAVGRVAGVLKLAAVPQTFPYGDGFGGAATSRWLILCAFVVVFGALAVALQRLKDRR